MKKKLTTVEFNGTKEQEEKLLKIIAGYKGVQGPMMPILQKAQDIYGYLPIEVQKIIARETGVSLEEIYGIVTFYSQFKLNPSGHYSVSICLGTACYVKGAAKIVEEVSRQLNLPVDSMSKDGKYSLEATRCVGACGLAPVMTINGDVYGRIAPSDVAGILAKYKD